MTTTMVMVTPKRPRVGVITIFGIFPSIPTIVDGPIISRGILVIVADVLSSMWGIDVPSHSWRGRNYWLMLLVLVVSRMHH